MDQKEKNLKVRKILFERLRYHERCALLDMELGYSPEQHILQVMGMLDYLKHADFITENTEKRIYSYFENLGACFEFSIPVQNCQYGIKW